MRAKGWWCELAECTWSATVDHTDKLMIHDVWAAARSCEADDRQPKRKRRRRAMDFSDHPHILLPFRTREEGIKILGHVHTMNNGASVELQTPDACVRVIGPRGASMSILACCCFAFWVVLALSI